MLIFVQTLLILGVVALLEQHPLPVRVETQEEPRDTETADAGRADAERQLQTADVEPQSRRADSRASVPL